MKVDLIEDIATTIYKQRFVDQRAYERYPWETQSHEEQQVYLSLATQILNKVINYINGKMIHGKLWNRIHIKDWGNLCSV